MRLLRLAAIFCVVAAAGCLAAALVSKLQGRGLDGILVRFGFLFAIVASACFQLARRGGTPGRP